MLERLTVRERVVIVGALLALITGLFYFQFYEPLKFERMKLEGEVEQKRFQYLQSMSLIRRKLPKLKEATSELEQQYQALLEKFPIQKEISVFLLEIEGLAKAEGIKLDYFSPKGMANQGDFYKLPINIAFFSSYQKMVAFIYALEQSPKMIEIENYDVKISPVREQGQLQVNLTVNIFIVQDQVNIEE